MTERAELMRIYRSNGISSISLMRDHYNKHDNGGDIQPSDATFRATLTNPVNSYRSNAPAGIGDAAITKATGLLNPITAATLTAAPLGAISKINAAAKAYKAAKIANPIIASTIGASSTSTGLAGYLDSRPDKKLSRDIEDKNYVGVASEMHSRLMDIRYFLKKKPGEIISKEEYMKAKEALDGDSRFENYDDDKMVEAINTIAFNNNNDKGSTA